MSAVEQPSGTVTMVFTDIEGSTRLLEKLGTEAYREALAAHRRVVRTACTRHEGYEVDAEGDAFFYTFASAQAAISAVSEAMRGLDGGPIRIRVGIHTGEPAIDPPKYLGMDVHRAARIMSAAHGGQVIISASTVSLLDGRSPLKQLGEHRLKDLGAPILLHQLLLDGLPCAFPPLRTLYRSNLPVPSTAFLGRQRELDALCGRLSDSDVRLVTLVGPGGAGKTRLALQAAAEVSEHFPDGVAWVALAPLRDASGTLPAVRQALEAPDRPGVGALEVVEEVLLGKRRLILLDNAEHLLPDIANEVAALVRACPTVTLLVTSRERLRISAEQTWTVPALDEADGQQLFIERARAAAVELGDDPDVPELCRRLEELPLALELAAARTVVFTPAQLIERLGQRLDLLKGDRDADPRQRTLRETIEWSYQLLDETERSAYEALAAFPGGCTLEAAEKIADAGADTLQALLDKSLVRLRQEEGERRYWMLETIREHALEQLESSGAADGFRQRLAEWLLVLAEHAVAEKWGPGETAWAERLEVEHANIVEAIHWLLPRDPRAATRLAAGVALVAWDGGARGREGRSLLQLTLNGSDQLDEGTRASALFALGRLAYTEDDRALERSAFEECIAIARRMGDEALEALALNELGWTALAENSLDESAALAESSCAMAIRLGTPHLRQRCLQLRGGLADVRGDLDIALGYHEEALASARSIGNRRAIVGELGNLANGALIRGDYALAVKHCEEALTTISASDIENRVFAVGNLGLAMLLDGSAEIALEHLFACLAMCRDLGMQRAAAEMLMGLAAHAAVEGHTDRALTLWASADALHDRSNSAPSALEDRLRTTYLEPLREAAARHPSVTPTTLDGAVAYALETGR